MAVRHASSDAGIVTGSKEMRSGSLKEIGDAQVGGCVADGAVGSGELCAAAWVMKASGGRLVTSSSTLRRILSGSEAAFMRRRATGST